MKIGSASIEITPDRPLHLLGQMHARIAQRTRDPLKVSAVVLGEGAQRLVLASVDICLMPDALVRAAQEAAAARTGIPARAILYAATHTHVAPCTVPLVKTQWADPDWLARLHTAMVEVVVNAVAKTEDCLLYRAEGWVAEMGYNRRGLHDGGKADMYWGSWRPNHEGIEGPRDGAVPVIAAKRADGTVKALITGFASHPNCVEGESFYSADLPGAIRDFLRPHLGPAEIIYLTGAAGNTAPSVMVNNPSNQQPWRGEVGLQRCGTYLGSEILKLVTGMLQPMAEQSVALAQRDLQVALKPWPADLKPETFPAGGFRDYFTEAMVDWPRRLQEESPVPVRLNVVRLGDAALCTNPAEFYVEHGLSIKQGSPAAMTMVAELMDGYCGYVPTRAAFARGGYSTWPAMSSKLAHDAGDQFVSQTQAMLAELFPKS
jgi:neutral ceramidase